MKLRQKLAAVLAATMMVTAVPVVTMAASDNYTQKVQQVIENKKDKGFESMLVIDLKDEVKATTPEVIYIDLNGAKFAEDKYKDLEQKTNYSITGVTEKQMTVTVTQANDTNSKIYVPILAKEMTADKATVEVTGRNVATNQKDIVVATVADQKATVTAEDAKFVYDEGQVAKITIDEQIAGTFEAGELINIELDNSDFEFKNVSALDAKVIAGRGFKTGDLRVVKEEKDLIQIEVVKATTEIGRITVEGVEVDLATGVKTPSLGDVNVTVSSNKSGISDKTVKVAEVKEFGSTVNITKAADMVAGKDAEVEVVLKETIKGETFRAGKKVEFTLENGFFVNQPSFDDKELTVVEFLDDEDKVVKPGKDAVTMVATMGTENATTKNFEVKDEIKFKVKVGTELGAKAEVMLNVEGRGIESKEATEVKVATVKAPFEVKAEKAVVKAGLNKQKAGKITLVETEKGKMDDITIKIDAEDAGITFADKPVVEGKDIKLGTLTQVKTTSSELNVKVPVTRSSKENATIEIKEFPVNVSRMAPEGSWDAEISMEGYYGTLKVENFLTIGTPNVEDLAANGLRKGSTSFVINSTKCIVNGVEKTLDAAPYVSAKNRTMIPVRALADAFGVDSKDIMFSNGTIVIIAGNKTVQLKNGSDVASVNGVQMKMDEKVTIKNNRAYAPASQIGNLLGVEPTWDGATQTASFTNK